MDEESDSDSQPVSESEIDDRLFSGLLSKIGDGLKLSREELDLIESRMFTEDEVDEMCPYGLRLFKENNKVSNYNKKVLEREENKDYSVATDVITNCPSSDIGKYQTKFQGFKVADTGGLPYELIFVIGKAYVITTNIDTTDGLVNGAVGELHHIQYSEHGLMTCVWLLFPSKKTGEILRKKNENYIQHNNINKFAVPIKLKKFSTVIDKTKNIKAVRTQFPLLAASAMTIHKSQGGTYTFIVYAYDKHHQQKLVYVAISRVTDTNGLFIIPTDGKKKFYHGYQDNDSCKEIRREIDRLRNEDALETISSTINKMIDNEKGISLYILNCVSLNQHHLDFNDTVAANTNVLLLSSTNMNDDQKLEIPNFTLISQQKRKDRRVAGVAIYQNIQDKMNRLQCNLIKLKELTNHAFINGIQLLGSDEVGDICSAECILKDGRKLFLVTTYISPGQNLEKIEKFLMKRLLPYSNTWKNLIKENNWSEDDYSSSPLVIGGDFNINFEDPDKDSAKKFILFLDRNFNVKLINDPKVCTTMKGNHKRGTTIDAVFARNIDDIQSKVFITYYSDHKPICTYIPFIDNC